MKSTFAIAAALLCTTVFVACTKHAGDMEDTTPTAAITFAAPTEGAVYKTGDNVSIQGLVLATAAMHGYEISVKNAADTSIVYYAEHIHDHNDTLQINQTWKNTLTTAADLQVAVTVVLDHNGHTATKTVGIKAAAN